MECVGSMKYRYFKYLVAEYHDIQVLSRVKNGESCAVS